MSKHFDKIIETKRLTDTKFRSIDDLKIDLNAYFIKEFGYKKPLCGFPSHNTLNFRRAAVDFYVRYYQNPQYEGMLLEIARIGFRETKAGHMTQLLRYIIEISDRHNIQNVAIEQTLTDEGIAAAKSFGFHNSFDKKNWIISVEELQHNLSKRKVVEEQN